MNLELGLQDSGKWGTEFRLEQGEGEHDCNHSSLHSGFFVCFVGFQRALEDWDTSA